VAIEHAPIEMGGYSSSRLTVASVCAGGSLAHRAASRHSTRRAGLPAARGLQASVNCSNQTADGRRHAARAPAKMAGPGIGVFTESASHMVHPILYDYNAWMVVPRAFWGL